MISSYNLCYLVKERSRKSQKKFFNYFKSFAKKNLISSVAINVLFSLKVSKRIEEIESRLETAEGDEKWGEE